MKLVSLVILSALFSQGAQAASACVLVVGNNNPFVASSVKVDDEYATFEAAQYTGITFYLRAGHGVARLEAWVKGSMIANTFYSYGRDPAETDNLRLNVKGPRGNYVEAQCSDVNARIGE